MRDAVSAPARPPRTGGAAPPDPALAEAAAAALEDLRAAVPLVQCITNTVVTNFTANVLLAVGASPAMTDIQGEGGVFAELADGLLVNTGTPTAEQRGAAYEAVGARLRAGRPWVLDPVAVGALPVRTAFARDLLEFRPAIVRGNASEVIGLAGGAGGRGTDATDGVDAARDAAAALAVRAGSAVAVSGPVDLVRAADGTVVRVPHGTPLLTRVTGGGCALGALMAAFTGVREDPAAAAVAATTVYTLAAEDAAAQAAGPGSFAVALLDRLDAITPEQVAARAGLVREGAAR
ncbi:MULTISPECIES: hydroxyethylthiazole kinase [Kocuria]|uniref:hydroxyethylthiazole kinase n=1 Tax=Kocuria TaxID=57493 RepID=UPI00203A918C|nr:MULTISPECIES: hydroxyethylthiazole kinase [Kocuria]MCM3689510.1 hydroxyethylthiazole kinase [Kocuria rosea]HST71411.1 hydroxyethylthiazole kinase [Kocuria rosea]